MATEDGTPAALRWVLAVQALALSVLALAHHVVPGSLALATFFTKAPSKDSAARRR